MVSHLIQIKIFHWCRIKDSISSAQCKNETVCSVLRIAKENSFCFFVFLFLDAVDMFLQVPCRTGSMTNDVHQKQIFIFFPKICPNTGNMAGQSNKQNIFSCVQVSRNRCICIPHFTEYILGILAGFYILFILHLKIMCLMRFVQFNAERMHPIFQSKLIQFRCNSAGSTFSARVCIGAPCRINFFCPLFWEEAVVQVAHFLAFSASDAQRFVNFRKLFTILIF